MSCNKCGSPEDCSCKQQALQINQICNPIECPVDECTETFGANCILWTEDDIICNDVILGTAGDSIAQIVANISAYFCSTEGVGDAIACGDDTVVPADTSFADAFPLVVAYFCSKALTETTVNAADAVGTDGCTTRTYTITFLAGAVTIDTVVFSTPPVCPPLDLCAEPTVSTPDVADEFLMCRDILGNPNIRKLTFQSILDAVLNALPGNILSAYNSQTGAGNLAGVSTLNAITVSIPGNTLANDGDEYEMDLYTEYKQNDPVDLEIGIGAGATWTLNYANAEDDKRFFKIIISRIDQNNQMWTIKSLAQNALSSEYVDEMAVIYTTKDLSTTENWTVKLINSGAAGANSLVLHKAVLKLNKV